MYVDCRVHDCNQRKSVILGILQTCICNIKFIIICIWKSNGLYSDYGKNSQDHFSFKGRDKKCQLPQSTRNSKKVESITMTILKL